jgi:hypothetical protein
VDRYDPSQRPDPTEWLELDGQGRVLLGEQHHRRVVSQFEHGVWIADINRPCW